MVIKMQNQTNDTSALKALGKKSDSELMDIILAWSSLLPSGFTLEDWDEAIEVVKATRDSEPFAQHPVMALITYQLLIIYRRYRDAEKRSSTASTTHSPTQTER